MKAIKIKKIIFLIYIALLLPSISNAQSFEEINKFLEGVEILGMVRFQDELWIASNGYGIFCYNYSSDSWKNYSTTNKNIENDLFYCIAASNDFVWAGSTDGLFMLDKKKDKWTKRKFGQGGQLGNWIRSLAFDPDNNLLWIGRFQFLTKYDLSQKKFSDYDLTQNGNDKTNTIKYIGVDGDSLIWFGTEDGIFKYFKNSDSQIPDNLIYYNNSLNNFLGEGNSVSISSFASDKNYVWIGTDEFRTIDNPDYNIGGLYFYNRKNDWDKLSKDNGLNGNGIYSIVITGGFIWISQYQFEKESKNVYGRGLSLFNKSNKKISPIYDDKISATIYTMLFDGTYLWLGTDNGLTRITLINRFARWNN